MMRSMICEWWEVWFVVIRCTNDMWSRSFLSGKGSDNKFYHRLSCGLTWITLVHLPNKVMIDLHLFKCRQKIKKWMQKQWVAEGNSRASLFSSEGVWHRSVYPMDHVIVQALNYMDWFDRSQGQINLKDLWSILIRVKSRKGAQV